MNWVSRKIHLYNVTMGLYMLDWWERCLFSILFYMFSLGILAVYGMQLHVLIAVLLWFVCYNTWRSTTDFFSR
ncbi:hypothetical protein Taro_015494 [Colocasia esculenta]|uniref:Uncharacterized protein n=1 Tax=Colocasia esculenta TaxID=4460 RepID=A0A843UBK7_COLES|nr:hypothetical protein [Colocasia esculenta]